jgi:anti-sigma-K factor RskA
MTDDDTMHEDGRPGDDLSELFGAYVLDALDDDERARVEARLAVDPEARAEVDRLAGAVDTALASDGPEMAPPSDLWDRIASDLPGEADGRPIGSGARDELAARRARRSPSKLGTAILGAAAAVIVIAIGAALVSRSDDSEPSLAVRLQHEADEVAAQRGSRTAELTSADGAATVTVVVDQSGRAFVTPHDLDVLGEDLTYQLWSMDDEPISLGLLGPDPTVAVLTIGGDPENLGISVEPASGSAAPTGSPVAAGTLA